MIKQYVSITKVADEVKESASNKLLMFDFYTYSLVAIDMILQSHKNFDSPIKLGEDQSLLDYATDCALLNVKGKFEPLPVSNLILESSFNYDSTEQIYIDTDDFHFEIEKSEKPYFTELLNLILNGYVKYLTQASEEFKLSSKDILQYKFQIVDSYFNDKKYRGMSDQFYKFYDSILHTQEPNIVSLHNHD